MPSTTRELHAQVTPRIRKGGTRFEVADPFSFFTIGDKTLHGVVSSTHRFTLTAPLTTVHNSKDVSCSCVSGTYHDPPALMPCSRATYKVSRREPRPEYMQQARIEGKNMGRKQGCLPLVCTSEPMVLTCQGRGRRSAHAIRPAGQPGEMRVL